MAIKDIVAEQPAEHQGRAPGLYDEQLQRQLQEKRLFQDMAEELHVLPSPAADKPLGRLRRVLHI